MIADPMYLDAPTGKARKREDYPTQEACERWQQLEEGEMKYLVLRHTLYARNRIQKMLGIHLSPIDIYHLRNITEQVLPTVIQHNITSKRRDVALLFPTDEIFSRFCIDVLKVTPEQLDRDIEEFGLGRVQRRVFQQFERQYHLYGDED